MKLLWIKTDKVVERHQWIHHGDEPYGFCENQGQYNSLIKRWWLCGIGWKFQFWWWEIDREEIPNEVWVEVATMGSTNWKSKFKGEKLS